MALTDDQKAMLRLLAQREQGYGDIAALTGQEVDGVRGKVREALRALEGDTAPAPDQQAILRLLAQREEGYEDIAALTGDSVDGVRGKVREALARLAGEEPRSGATPQPPPVPPEPAAAPEKPAATPEPPKPAPPPTAEKPASEPVAGKPAAAASSTRSRLQLPENRGAVIGLGAGLVVVLVLVILLATGAFSGSDEESESASGSAVESAISTGQASSPGGLKPTQAVLKPVDGSDASGRALFGKAKKQVILLLRAKGLDPAPRGQSYTISLAKSPSERLPLVATQVNKDGEVVGTFPIAPQVLGLLASGFDEMELSLVANSELSAALKAARHSKAAPNYGGTDVLRGPVTGAIVEAGERGKVNP
jgi:hypothetical protein